MIEINLQKLDRGTRKGKVRVTRGGKTFWREQRLGVKEQPSTDSPKLYASKNDTPKTDGHKSSDINPMPYLKEYNNAIKEVATEFDGLLDSSGGRTFIGVVKDFIDHSKTAKGIDVKYGKNTQNGKKVFDKLDTIISDKYDGELNISVNSIAYGERSYMRGDSIHVDVNNESIDRFIFHEVGHIMESCGENYEVTSAFIRHRTAGERIIKLNDIFPEAGYDDDEVTLKDHFVNPYTGKYCSGDATEVLSVGLEQFTDASDAKSLYYNDKEHFMLTLAILSGKFIKGED